LNAPYFHRGLFVEQLSPTHILFQFGEAVLQRAAPMGQRVTNPTMISESAATNIWLLRSQSKIQSLDKLLFGQTGSVGAKCW